MDRAELFDLWKANKDRPAFVREYREELMEHTNTEEEIPNASIYEVRQWLDRYKGTVTRQLNDDAEDADPHDTDDAATAEGEA